MYDVYWMASFLFFQRVIEQIDTHCALIDLCQVEKTTEYWYYDQITHSTTEQPAWRSHSIHPLKQIKIISLPFASSPPHYVLRTQSYVNSHVSHQFTANSLQDNPVKFLHDFLPSNQDIFLISQNNHQFSTSSQTHKSHPHTNTEFLNNHGCISLISSISKKKPLKAKKPISKNMRITKAIQSFLMSASNTKVPQATIPIHYTSKQHASLLRSTPQREMRRGFTSNAKRTFDLLSEPKQTRISSGKQFLLQNFQSDVQTRYQLLTSLFQTLPVEKIEEMALLLPLLSVHCRKGFENGESPQEVLESFFKEHQSRTEKEQIGFLIRVVQFVERQIVIVDALEDVSYTKINDISGLGSLQHIIDQIERVGLDDQLKAELRKFAVKIVLTAHPTQFYPKSVLAIINDLDAAITDNDLTQIEFLLWQLAKTPFYQKEKPTPYDEAQFLIQYLENVFYDTVGQLQDRLSKVLGNNVADSEFHKFFTLGFWPGGDRDGNPFVRVKRFYLPNQQNNRTKVDTTKKVSQLLRTSILTCYIKDMKQVKRRLSFKGVHDLLEEIERELIATLNSEGVLTLETLKKKLDIIREKIKQDHAGLFLPILENFQRKVHTFGYHFASIDIRQDSRVLDKTFAALLDKIPYMLPHNFSNLPIQEQLNILFTLKPLNVVPSLDDPVLNDTLQTFNTMRDIQLVNGESGCYRFIISNCRGPLDVAKVFALSALTGRWNKNSHTIDIVPLFETINDLKSADSSMRELYTNNAYNAHLAFRSNKQTIMCGFSDGTKDGGYLGANWGIYQAKENLTKISREFGVDVVFFDGRGGPPARGGGNKHLFYASQGPTIENHEIQITIQGQTISSNFGVADSCQHNLELLMSAGLQNNILEDPKRVLTPNQRSLLNELSETSLQAYIDFKAHPQFLPYLQEKSPLKYYAEANIGSRPAKRTSPGEMKFEDLRAIPFVGAWSQLKQNVPGFYGFGTALKKLEAEGRLQEAQDLYKENLFFKALVENSMQSMSKTYFPLTFYMKKDPKYSEFWNMIYSEFLETQRLVLQVAGQQTLLETDPVVKSSIKLREGIVLPLLAIQQYALQKAEQNQNNEEILKSYQHLIMRSLFGNINATRNAA